MVVLKEGVGGKDLRWTGVGVGIGFYVGDDDAGEG